MSTHGVLQRPDISPSEKRIGELLLQEELLTPEQLEQALLEQSRNGTRLGYCVVAMGYVTEEQLTEVLARQFQVEAVDLSEIEIDPKILRLIPAEFASKHLVFPLRRVGRTLTVAMADPTDLNVMDDLKFITRFDIEPVVAGEYSLRQAIERYYDIATDRLGNLLEELEEQEVELVEETRRRKSAPASCGRRSTTRRWCGSSTACSPTPCAAGPPTSTSSPTNRNSGSATGSTAPCTRS